MTPQVVGGEKSPQAQFLIQTIQWYIDHRRAGPAGGNAQLGVTYPELIQPFMRHFGVDEMTAVVAINEVLKAEDIILVRRRMVEREGRYVSSRLDWVDHQFFKIPWEIGQTDNVHLHRFYLIGQVPRVLKPLVRQMERNRAIVRELTHGKLEEVKDASA